MIPEENTESAPFDFFTMKKILVATDFTPPSIRAIRVGLDLARKMGVELLLLHVEEESQFYSDCMLPPVLPLETQMNRQRVLRRLDQLVKKLLESGPRGQLPRIRTIATDGDPAGEIVKTAFDDRAELILIGSHGRLGIQRFLLGSTAEKVTRYASCPVLVIRGNKDELNMPPVKIAPKRVLSLTEWA